MNRGSSQYSLEARVDGKRWPLVILNVLVLLVSLATFSICMWIRFDLDFREWIDEIGWYSYWNGTYIVMIAMFLSLANSILSSYGAVINSRCILWCSLFLVLITWIVELAGATVVSIYGFEESETLTRDLRDVFNGLIFKVDQDWRAARILNIVQEYVGCCGARGSEDYINARKPVPMQCRDPVRGIEYRYGCAQKFAWWLEPWTASMAGVCVGLLVVHVVVLVLIVRLIGQIKNYKQVRGREAH